jgi:hypothetical protein
VSAIYGVFVRYRIGFRVLPLQVSPEGGSPGLTLTPTFYFQISVPFGFCLSGLQPPPCQNTQTRLHNASTLATQLDRQGPAWYTIYDDTISLPNQALS